MKAEIQERFRNFVQYDNMMGKVFSGYDLLHLTVLSYLSTKLGENASVLDVGCGTGTSLITWATHQPAWSLTGVDPTEQMLDFARVKVEDAGLNDRVQLQVGFVDVLAPEEQFDAVTLILVEHLQPDDGTKQASLQGIADRLKPGGWFVLAGLYGDFDTAETQLALDAWQDWLVFQGFPEEARQDFHNKATVEDSFSSASRIQELLDDAGFQNAEQIYKTHLLGAWLVQKK